MPPAKSPLLTHTAIPPWQRDNDFLLSGYRPTAGSWPASLRSIFALHNETVSIHTHLLGALLFVALYHDFWSKGWGQVPGAQTADLVVVGVYCGGVVVCFVCSVVCHVGWNHSAPVAALGNRLDYLGIVVLMWGAAVASVYYGLYCHEGLRGWYWVLVTGFGIACAVSTVSPRFSNPGFRKWRAVTYAGLGVTGVVFVLHGVLLNGVTVQKRRMSIDWMVLMAGLNFVGAAAYAARVCTFFPSPTADAFGVVLGSVRTVCYGSKIADTS